jgi:ABC-type glycerol-3-phosphate transport system permease component
MSWRARDPQAILPRGLNAVAICAIAAFALAPVLFMVLMSVTPDAEVAGGSLWPSHLALDNYVQMWSTVPLMSGLVNSITAALTAAVIATAFAVGAAYCLTRFTFVGRRPYLASLVTLQSVPHVMLLLPLFMVFSSAGTYLGLPLVGTRTALVITYLTFALPLATWVMVTYLRKIPESLEEAGLIDGLSRFGTLWRIVVPLSWPGMVVALVFSFLIGWNDVVFASVLTHPDTRTAAVELQVFGLSLEGGALPLYGQLMGASVVCSVPVVALYLVFQRYLVSGLTAGGVKG